MKQKILSLETTTGSYSAFVERLTELANGHISSYACVANVHMLIEAHVNSEFAAMVNAANIVTPDGMPLVIGLKLLYGIDQERVAGMDLLPDLLLRSEKDNISVFFYGGTQEMLDNTNKYCRDFYPDLKIAGLYSPPFRMLTPEEDISIAEMINKSNPGFVFVALGCPKQEKWMSSMKGRINACMVGIGGALPVMIGMQARAPKWMQKMSLEWLFRLAQEPKRLFKRYAVTNSMFIWLLLKQLGKQGFKPISQPNQ